MSNKSFKGIIIFLCFLLVFFCLMAVVLQAMSQKKADTESGAKPTTGVTSEQMTPTTEGVVVGTVEEKNQTDKTQPTAAESRLLLKHYAVGIITAIFLILAVVIAVLSKRKDMNELSEDNHFLGR